MHVVFLLTIDALATHVPLGRTEEKSSLLNSDQGITSGYLIVPTHNLTYSQRDLGINDKPNPLKHLLNLCTEHIPPATREEGKRFIRKKEAITLVQYIGMPPRTSILPTCHTTRNPIEIPYTPHMDNRVSHP